MFLKCLCTSRFCYQGGGKCVTMESTAMLSITSFKTRNNVELPQYHDWSGLCHNLVWFSADPAVTSLTVQCDVGRSLHAGV